MATSRQRLEVPGEAVWPLGALTESVQLFTERAAQRISGYEPADQTAAVLAEICRRLDGLPLAIELASAWARVQGESEILEPVTGNLDLLEARGTGLPEGHRTIADTIVWSRNS